MLIDSVVQREAVRNEQMILQYESLIGELPKGSITCRKNGYYYLRYREDGKLYDRYIGKGAEKVDAIREKLALRKHYMGQEQFAAIMPYISADLVGMIVKKKNISEPDAITKLYNSKLYAALEQEDTKVWQ